MIHAKEAFDIGARLALAGEANLAPSAYNIQPARFRFLDDGAIAVLEDRRRRMPAVDPSGAESWRSLGAAAEGLVIALTGRGFASHVVWSDSDAGDPLRVVARVTVAGDAAPDKLRAIAPRRATWRGRFAPAQGRSLDALRAAGDLLLVEDRRAIADLAALHDAETLARLRDPARRQELRRWMRLSRLNAQWSRDGLNAQALSMGAVAALGADFTHGDSGFALLDRMRLSGPFTGESGVVRSAAALGVFHRPAEEHDFDTGRRFYRLWLDIAAAGFCLCPMSTLAQPAAAATLRSRFGIEAARKIVSVFRIGVRPERARQPRRARLAPHKLLV